MSFANLNKSADTCKFFHTNTINTISWSICSILRYHSGQRKMWNRHGVKSVQIRNFFWSVFSCIWAEYRKIRTKNNSAFGHFSCRERNCVQTWFFRCRSSRKFLQHCKESCRAEFQLRVYELIRTIQRSTSIIKKLVCIWIHDVLVISRKYVEVYLAI